MLGELGLAALCLLFSLRGPVIDELETHLQGVQETPVTERVLPEADHGPTDVPAWLAGLREGPEALSGGEPPREVLLGEALRVFRFELVEPPTRSL